MSVVQVASVGAPDAVLLIMPVMVARISFIALGIVCPRLAAASGEWLLSQRRESSPSNADVIPVPDGWKVVAMLPATPRAGSAFSVQEGEQSAISTHFAGTREKVAEHHLASNTAAVATGAVQPLKTSGSAYSMEAALASVFSEQPAGVTNSVTAGEIGSSTSPPPVSTLQPHQQPGHTSIDSSAAAPTSSKAVSLKGGNTWGAAMPEDPGDIGEEENIHDDMPLAVPLVVPPGPDLDLAAGISPSGSAADSTPFVPASTLSKIQTVDCLSETLENGDCTPRKEQVTTHASGEARRTQGRHREVAVSHASGEAHRSHRKHREVAVRRLRHRRV